MIMSLLDWPHELETLATTRLYTSQIKRALSALCLNKHSEDLVDMVNLTVRKSSNSFQRPVQYAKAKAMARPREVSFV